MHENGNGTRMNRKNVKIGRVMRGARSPSRSILTSNLASNDRLQRRGHGGVCSACERVNKRARVAQGFKLQVSNVVGSGVVIHRRIWNTPCHENTEVYEATGTFEAVCKRYLHGSFGQLLFPHLLPLSLPLHRTNHPICIH